MTQSRPRALLIGALLLPVLLTATSCSQSRRAESPPPATSQTDDSASAKMPDDGNRAETVIDNVRVAAVVAEADAGRSLAVTAGAAAPPPAEVEVGSTDWAAVTLDGGTGQPSAPVQLSFDLSDRPDLAGKISDTVRPAIQSMSATNPDQRDMFAATWHPDTKTVTATVDHLTGFRLSLFDVAQAIVRLPTFAELRGTTDSPCRERSSAHIGDLDYELTALNPGPVAGCLADDGGTVAIDFDNATGAYYSVRIAPESVTGSWGTSGVSGTSAAAGLLATLTSGGVGTLTSKGTGRLRLNENVDEAEVRLHPQPQGSLAAILNTAVGMYGVTPEVLDTVAGAWDCFATGADAGYDSSRAVVELVNGIGQCLINAGGAAAGKNWVLKEALHRLATTYNLLFDVPLNLWDFLATGLQQIAHEHEVAFHLVGTGPPTEAPAPEPASVIDRIDVTTWAYNRVDGDTYTADNLGHKTVYFYWKSYAGDEQITSKCTSTLTVTGPGLTQTKQVSGCDSYNPGTYVDLRRPGVYTGTVEVVQEGRVPVVASRQVTVLPN